MNRRKEYTPVTVPFAATPPGEPPSIRDWAHHSVWTDRMLTTLEQEVKGGRWHTLIDKVSSGVNLSAATRSVVNNKGAAGVDHQSVQDFETRQITELRKITDALRNDTYRPQAVRRTWIPKPGTQEKRPLGIPTVRDRVVQTALLHVIEPIYDNTFAEHSYGFRHGRSCQQALERVESLLNEGYVHIVDADLKSYFDTIPHDRLLDRMREKVSDSRILRLIEMYLAQGVMEGLSLWTPEEGTPQGAVISPLLANIYLNPLDHFLTEAGFAMVRYADDFVILCRSRDDADRALGMVREWVCENGLTLHPTKTKIVNAQLEGFDFLGYQFRGKLRLPRSKSLAKVKTTIRALTRRNHGSSMEYTCKRISSILRGWFTYFRHCHWSVFRALDRWIRMRLRSILRQRAGRRGRGRGADHHRWPNTYFDDLGLFSLGQAHARLCQSSTG